MNKFCNGATCFIAGAVLGPPAIILGVKALLWGICAWADFIHSIGG